MARAVAVRLAACAVAVRLARAVAVRLTACAVAVRLTAAVAVRLGVAVAVAVGIGVAVAVSSSRMVCVAVDVPSVTPCWLGMRTNVIVAITVSSCSAVVSPLTRIVKFADVRLG